MGEFSKFYKSLLKVVIAFLLVCSPIIFFNTVVDPYGIFFKAFKYIPMEPNKRYMKMRFLLDNPDKFDSFIFGSSRANSITPENIPNNKYFNMTYSGGMPSQHLEDIQELLQNGVKIKNLLIGIDYSSLLENPGIAESDLLRKKYPESLIEKILFYKAYLFNIPDLEFVKLALVKSTIDRSTLLENGIITNKKHDSIIDALPLKHLSNVNLVTPYSFYNTPNSEISKNIKQIEKIIQIAKTNNINLYIYINPTQSTTFINLDFENYLEALKSLSKVTDFYDFSGLNSIAIDNMNFYEASHFRVKVGNLIIAKIFDIPNKVIPSDFGHLVNKNNVHNIINLHKKWYQEFIDATSIDKSYISPIDLKKMVKIKVNPNYSIQTVNEINFNYIKQPMLITTPWIKMKGNVGVSDNIGEISDVFIQIGKKLFKANYRDNGHEEKHINKTTNTNWQITIPTNFIEEGLLDVKLVLVSEDKTKFSITGTTFKINHLQRYKPINIAEIKTDSTPINYAIDLINEIKSNEFAEVSDEKTLNIKGWAIDDKKQKPIGGVIVHLDGKAYLSQFIYERTDIAEHFDNPDLIYAGWGISIPISNLTLGEHELKFKFLNKSRTAFYTETPKIKFNKIKLQLVDFFKGLKKSDLNTTFSIEVINENLISKIKEPISINENKIKISGWAIDQPAKKSASNVIVVIDGKDYKATYGIERPDVAKFYKNKAFTNSGWRIEIPAKIIGKGKHKLKLKILTNDKLSYFETDKEIIFLIN